MPLEGQVLCVCVGVDVGDGDHGLGRDLEEGCTAFGNDE